MRLLFGLAAVSLMALPPAPPGERPHVLRIRGDDARLRLVAEALGSSGSGALGGPACLPPPPRVQDGWTASFECFQSTFRECPSPITIRPSENYEFRLEELGNLAAVDPFDVGFVLQLKVPPGGLPGGMMFDLVIQPSSPRSASNPLGEDLDPRSLPRPLVLLDDVAFPAVFFPAVPDGIPYSRTIGLFFADLAEIVGPGAFDWWVMAAFDPASCADLDGDMMPDAGVTLGRDNPTGNIAYCATMGADAFGADAIDFLLFRGAHGLRRLDVFEARGDFPPAEPTATGRQAGEDSTTRPWSFALRAPALHATGVATGGGTLRLKVIDPCPPGMPECVDLVSVPVLVNEIAMEILEKVKDELRNRGYDAQCDPDGHSILLTRFSPAARAALGHERPRAANFVCEEDVPGIDCSIAF